MESKSGNYQMIKVIGGILISITLSLGLVAQTEFTYFNKTYNPDTLTYAMLSTNVLEVEGGYLVAGIYGQGGEDTYLYLRKIDEKGNMIWLKHIDQGGELNTLSSGELLIKSIYQNEVIITYYKTTVPDGPVANLRIVRFDAQCDQLIWETIIDDGFSRVPYKIIETNNAEFLVVGSHAEIAPELFAQINIGRYDFLGNQVWEKQFGYSGAGFGVVQDEEGFIYVSGHTFNDETNFDPYLIKLTEQGDSLWTRTYGGGGVDCGGYLSLMPNGNILYNGCEEIDWGAQMYLAEITPDGDLVWEKVFIELDHLEIFQTNVELIENPFVTIARGIRLDKNQYGNWSNTWTEINLTTKQVFKEIDIPLNPQKDSYIKDMERTSDGGYILCGFQYTSPQLSWVVKTDSLGNTCNTIGCDSTVMVVGIDEPVLSEHTYSVYPNPVYVGEALQFTNPSNDKETLYLIDLQGKTIREYEVFGSQGLDIKGVGSGSYILRNSNGSWNQKVVIIK